MQLRIEQTMRCFIAATFGEHQIQDYLLNSHCPDPDKSRKTTFKKKNKQMVMISTEAKVGTFLVLANENQIEYNFMPTK
jgi:hypothetical protein